MDKWSEQKYAEERLVEKFSSKKKLFITFFFSYIPEGHTVAYLFWISFWGSIIKRKKIFVCCLP